MEEEDDGPETGGCREATELKRPIEYSDYALSDENPIQSGLISPVSHSPEIAL